MTKPQCYGNMNSYEPKSSADQPVKEDNMLDQQKITILYCRLSVEDIKDKDNENGKKSGSREDESNSIQNQELLCKGWFHPPNTYDCGSFVVN